jgi:hypothetical protein
MHPLDGRVTGGWCGRILNHRRRPHTARPRSCSPGSSNSLRLVNVTCFANGKLPTGAHDGRGMGSHPRLGGSCTRQTSLHQLPSTTWLITAWPSARLLPPLPLTRILPAPKARLGLGIELEGLSVHRYLGATGRESHQPNCSKDEGYNLVK